MKLYPLLFEPNLHTVVWGGKRNLMIYLIKY